MPLRGVRKGALAEKRRTNLGRDLAVRMGHFPGNPLGGGMRFGEAVPRASPVPSARQRIYPRVTTRTLTVGDSPDEADTSR